LCEWFGGVFPSFDQVEDGMVAVRGRAQQLKVKEEYLSRKTRNEMKYRDATLGQKETL
jgi:hypothetical protein